MGQFIRIGLLGVDVLERFIGWLFGSLGNYWYGSMEIDFDDEESV